jgi:hypothetical protein
MLILKVELQGNAEEYNAYRPQPDSCIFGKQGKSYWDNIGNYLAQHVPFGIDKDNI